MMNVAERKRLIAAGVTDDENDAYPRICECCGTEFPGSADAAFFAGWRVGPDGWACRNCYYPSDKFMDDIDGDALASAGF